MVPANPVRKARIAPASREAGGAPGKARRVLQRNLEQLRPGPELATGVLYCEDNLKQLAMMPAASVDLVYLDPPFFSNRDYEVIWGDEAEVRSFEDRWSGGIQVYIQWMRDRLMEVRRVLKPTGSVYLHCDPHASHYLKVMMDEVFGQSNFRSEVVWKRTFAHGGARRYGPVHDLILFYSVSDNYTWRPQFGAYTESYLENFFKFKDPDGRRYRATILTGSGVRHGDSGKPWRGIDPTLIERHWAVPGFLRRMLGEPTPKTPQEALDRLDKMGRILWPAKKGGTPSLKQYEDDMEGAVLQDVWTDVPPISAQARERLGYPTQKPEALLRRIIASSSDEGSIVLDPFCGCGTTISVAHQLKRQWIGIDISPTACNLMVRRLAKVGAVDVMLHGMPTTLDELRQLRPFEFQNWVIDRLNGQQANRRTGDMGIDGWTFFLHDPVQIKQSDGVGRNVVDNFETAIERAGKMSGAIVAFSFGRGAHEEVARVKQKGITIHLLTVSDLLERLDWAMRQLGISGGKPDLKVAPLPQFDATRHTSDELIASASGRA